MSKHKRVKYCREWPNQIAKHFICVLLNDDLKTSLKSISYILISPNIVNYGQKPWVSVTRCTHLRRTQWTHRHKTKPIESCFLFCFLSRVMMLATCAISFTIKCASVSAISVFEEQKMNWNITRRDIVRNAKKKRESRHRLWKSDVRNAIFMAELKSTTWIALNRTLNAEQVLGKRCSDFSLIWRCDGSRNHGKLFITPNHNG